LCVSH
jgi:hypothetical protein